MANETDLETMIEDLEAGNPPVESSATTTEATSDPPAGAPASPVDAEPVVEGEVDYQKRFEDTQRAYHDQQQVVRDYEARLAEYEAAQNYEPEPEFDPNAYVQTPLTEEAFAAANSVVQRYGWQWAADWARNPQTAAQFGSEIANEIYKGWAAQQPIEANAWLANLAWADREAQMQDKISTIERERTEERQNAIAERVYAEIQAWPEYDQHAPLIIAKIGQYQAQFGEIDDPVVMKNLVRDWYNSAAYDAYQAAAAAAAAAAEAGAAPRGSVNTQRRGSAPAANPTQDAEADAFRNDVLAGIR